MNMTPPRSDVEVLRELPEPAAGYGLGCNVELAIGQPLFTAEQMREYALAAIEVMEGKGWRPIESAPKDGTWVQLTGGRITYGWDGGDQPAVVVGQYTDELNGGTTDEHWQFAWYDGGYYGEYNGPTHWMPLPTPPQPNEEKGK